MEDSIQNIKIKQSVEESYLEYSMSVIIGRALPDARDGLKPVHRRILYAMHELGMGARSAHKKSARIVGDVIGKYHPHGDSAVYDALVRMAQDFSMRLQLIDGQGNFGSMDGDSAAAMRYTEARMTLVSEEMLHDIEKETVNFVPNYDGSQQEPEVLPSRIPNLLVNGSNGIAVGMATNIPPHRLSEVIDAMLCLIDNPHIELNKIMEFLRGPDFPTGGIIYGKQGIYEAYATGRGRVKVRAKTHIEHTKTKDLIVIDELPYQVNKARLVEQIAELTKEKVIEGISDVRDESDRDGVRVVVELKRDAMSEIVLNHLFKSTPMESTFGIILLAIYDKRPKIFTLIELLHLFINHRKSVIIRRIIFELQKARSRVHLLEGLRIALENIDDIVALVKSSQDPKIAKAELVERYALSDIQAQAILDMRLQRLTGLERDKIETEYTELLERIAKLEIILKSEEELNKVIKGEFHEIREKFYDERRTEIQEDYESIDEEDLIPNESVVVTMSHRGYVKRVPTRVYEKQHRGGKGKTSANTHDDDFIESFFVSDTHDTILFLTDRGQLYRLKVYRIPEASRIAIGKAVVNLINLAAGEKIKATITTKDFSSDKSIAFFTKKGLIKRTNLNEFRNIRSVGIKAISLDDDDELVTAKIIDNEKTQQVLCVTYHGLAVRFLAQEVRNIGRSTRGVTAIRFKEENDYVIGAVVIDSESEEILSVSEQGIGKRTEASEYRMTKRGGKGVIAMKLTNKTGQLVGIVNVDESMDLMVLTGNGKMIRVDMQSIRKAGRNTSGVIIVDVAEGEKVVSIAKCPKEEKQQVLL